MHLVAWQLLCTAQHRLCHAKQATHTWGISWNGAQHDELQLPCSVRQVTAWKPLGTWLWCQGGATGNMNALAHRLQQTAVNKCYLL